MQARPFLLLICLAVLSVTAFSFVRKREPHHALGPDDASSLSSLLMTPEAVAALADLSETEFRRSLMESANALRAKRGYHPLSPDPRLEQWLTKSAPHLTCANLEKTLAAAEFPDFQSIRAAGVSGGSLRDLLPRHLDNLSLPASDQEDRCGILVRSLPDQGCEVIVISGKSLPQLSLASLGDGSGGAFVSACPHCGKRSAYHNEKTPSTLSLTCPACGRGIRLLGRDTKGRYHDASAFLIPSPCPTPPRGSHPLDAMISIWQAAVTRCRYVEDGEEDGETADFWQTPRQTLQKGTGDCEDSALLLTDWMLANNIPARMAMGTLKDGGHAWCIVRVEGTDYLLESTNRNPDLENLPAVNPRDGYVPTALVDRDALYVRADPGKPFDGDYWSPQKWIRLPRAKAAPAKTAPVPKNVALKP